jgi:ABC-type nitrate/sulfonate/bicarbonate transport system permease component
MKLKRKISTLLLGFALWEVAVLFAHTQSFPHLWDVLIDFFALVFMPTFWSNFGLTVWLTVLGLSLGLGSALVVGFFIGLNRQGDIASTGLLNFFRSVPSVVFLPLLVASMGSSARTAVIVTAMVVSFKLVIYVIRGVRDTDPLLIESAQAMRLPVISKLLFIYLPSTVSILSTGIRLAASRAFGTVIAAGIVAGTPGLGAQLYLAESSANYERTFSYVLVMGLMGAGIYSATSKLERRFIFWRVLV